MDQQGEAVAVPDAPTKFEARGDDMRAKPRGRAGWKYDLPGELLKPDSNMWTETQRRDGIKIACVFPTATDEKLAIQEAIADGGGGGTVVYVRVRNAIHTIDGQLVQFIEREMIWEALGVAGREMAAEMYLLANTPNKEAAAKARASFSLTA